MPTSPGSVERLPHDRSHLLCEDGQLDKPSRMLLDSIDRWTSAMLEDDLAEDNGLGENVVGKVFSRNRGVIAGRYAVERMIGKEFRSCSVSWHIGEGQMVGSGDQILSIEGPSEAVLKCERVLLNIVSRMSGIATETAEWLIASGGFPVACTRKTEWGLLDKWAVHVGGGLTHRLNREDAPLIKENDLAVLEFGSGNGISSVASAVKGVDFEKDSAFCIVEVCDAGQALEAATVWSECQKDRGGCEKIVLLLDNMGPSLSSMASAELVREGLRNWCILEGSGGVNRGNLRDWVSDSDVDLVSSSAVNMGVTPLDISMIIGGSR